MTIIGAIRNSSPVRGAVGANYLFLAPASMQFYIAVLHWPCVLLFFKPEQEPYLQRLPEIDARL